MYENMETQFFSMRATLWIVLLLSPAIYAQGCNKGWFGPGCLNVDLIYTENDGNTKTEFIDADDSTCNENTGHTLIAVTFKKPISFKWLRLFFQRRDVNIWRPRRDVSLTVVIPTPSATTWKETDKLSIFTVMSEWMSKKLLFQGSAVGHLCSVYASGDCPHTLYGSRCENKCSTDCVASYCTGYNGRCDQCPDGKMGDQCGLPCSSTTWGPRCVKPCSVACKNQQCNSVTGICNECPSGKTGDQCDQACTSTRWGPRCVKSCSRDCKYTQCNAVNGICYTCSSGKTGDQCDQDCPRTQYGSRCAETCSKNCINQYCTGDYGRCDDCPAGKTGYLCDTTCSSTKWGPKCGYACRMACKNRQCDSVTGICNDCPSGKTGDQCNQDCLRTQYGSRCVGTCSTNCVNQYCTGDNGRCDQCPDGKTGDYCETTGCPATKYGPRCSLYCDSNCRGRLCDAVSGVCTSCPSGKNGDLCDQDCSPTTYGSRCTGTCSTGCEGQLCSEDNGRCNNCPSGKTGAQCDQDCLPTQYGSRCAGTCSTKCAYQLCTGNNGRCDNCTSGWMGDYCDQRCQATFYGPRCINSCSGNCVDSKCDRFTGECIKCPDGKHGEQCDRDCPPGQWGNECKETCSDNCFVARECDPKNGTCVSGCSDGYIGNFCDSICDIGTYGAGCSYNCSEFCNTTGLTDQETPCHYVNGTCLNGCDDTHEGPICKQAVKLPANDTASVGAIVGAILAVIVIVALIVVGVLLWRRKKKKGKDAAGIFGNSNKTKSSKSDEQTGFVEPRMSKADGNPYENVEIAAGTNQMKIAAGSAKATTAKPDIKPKPEAKPKKGDDPATYYNTGNLGKSKSTSISIGQLQAFVAATSKEFFKKQFESIPDNKKATTKIAQNAENNQKNRYKNICAYDHSRVCLQADKEKSLGDYINATYIEGYNGEEKFIASQGPTKIIMDDFIRMLWEQKVEKVVMLTNLVEEGKMKCEKYWPDDEKQWFGDIKMVLTTTEIFADYTIRRLHLTKKGEPVQQLTHFHFTSWPDKGVPTIPWGLVDFEQRVASYPTSKPIVVHCSAGVGRTGTFIALRNVMREAEDTGYVDCFATVQKLRKDRVNMVQTAEQYEFLHRAAQVAMVCLGTTVTSANIQDRITKLEAKTPAGQTLMEHEFAAICSVCADDEETDSKQEEAAADSTDAVYENSSVVANKLKDRLKNVPAKEQYRTILARENDDMGDYINAVLVPSFRKLDQQILTQLPLPTTVTDFWRLVTQYKVALVVAFDMGCDDKESSVADYLPLKKDETISVPLFKIKSGSISRGEISEVQQVTVEAVDVDMRRKSMPVFLNGQHHLTHVKYMSPDLNPKKLLDLIKQVREHFPGPEGRVIFMCRNGATYSGLMCVLTLLLDRMDNDLRLTVPLVVGAIKSIRPQVIPTLDQYKLLYQILHMYNESNNVYSNFGEAQTPEMSHKKMKEEEEENAGVYANN